MENDKKVKIIWRFETNSLTLSKSLRDMEKNKEMVNHPSHYCQGDMECIDGIVGAFGKDKAAVFCKINAFKYLWRLGHKDDEAQEIGKLKWYLDKYLELKMPPQINAMALDGTPIWLRDEAGTSIVKELSKSDLKRLGLTDREAENIINKK